jgi:hypothetical protein
MLPDDTKHRKNLAKAAAANLRQPAIDEHFTQATPEDKPMPYTDALFQEAAIEWLIETNQVRSYHLDVFLYLTAF